jgi:hypothetical protein
MTIGVAPEAPAVHRDADAMIVQQAGKRAAGKLGCPDRVEDRQGTCVSCCEAGSCVYLTDVLLPRIAQRLMTLSGVTSITAVRPAAKAAVRGSCWSEPSDWPTEIVRTEPPAGRVEIQIRWVVDGL